MYATTNRFGENISVHKILNLGKTDTMERNEKFNPPTESKDLSAPHRIDKERIYAAYNEVTEALIETATRLSRLEIDNYELNLKINELSLLNKDLRSERDNADARIAELTAPVEALVKSNQQLMHSWSRSIKFHSRILLNFKNNILSKYWPRG